MGTRVSLTLLALAHFSMMSRESILDRVLRHVPDLDFSAPARSRDWRCPRGYQPATPWRPPLQQLAGPRISRNLTLHCLSRSSSCARLGGLSAGAIALAASLTGIQPLSGCPRAQELRAGELLRSVIWTGCAPAGLRALGLVKNEVGAMPRTLFIDSTPDIDRLWRRVHGPQDLLIGSAFTWAPQRLEGGDSGACSRPATPAPSSMRRILSVPLLKRYRPWS